MSILEWRKFNFFNLLPHVDSKKLRNIKTKITCQCFNTWHQTRIFCDALGWVHVYPRNWERISFQIDSCAINLCATTEESNLLLTLIQNQTSFELNLQIFNLHNITKRGGAPCVGMAKLTHANKATVMKACMNGFALCVAIGFENGYVCFHRGALSRDISSSFRTLIVCSRAIVGIEFGKKEPHTLNMFLCSNGGVFCYSVSENNTVAESKVILDSNPTKTSSCCASLSKNTGQANAFFTVARDDAVYCFNCDGRGPCYVIEGKKERVAWFNNNLLVVTEMKARCKIIIIDILNKFVVFEKNMNMITDIVVENSSCFIFTVTKEVFALRERTLEKKLSLLVEKNLYDVALKLLNATEDSANIGNVNIQYGDFLLHKGNVSGAIAKYILTIGYIEPYSVLQRLRNFKYNKYLEQYLTAYVKVQNNAENYIYLLQNCRERLNLALTMEPVCLGKVVKESYEINIQSNTEVLKSNVSAFLNRVDDPQKLDQYLSSLHESQIDLAFLLENCSLLMARCPIQITKILKSLCNKHNGMRISSPEKFLPLLIPYVTYCIEFLEFIIKNDFECKTNLHNLLLEMYLRMWRNKNKKTEDIISFIKNHDGISLPDILIICRNHSFWDGILCIYDSKNEQHLYARYLIKCYKNEKSAFSIEHCSNLKSNIWIPSLIKGDISSVNLKALINNIINAQFWHKEQSFIQILKTISTNENLMVLHMKKVFSPEHLQTAEKENQLNQLCHDIQKYKQLFSYLLKNPIEFRVSTCYICKQQLELPAIYFLCQHSFHKECLSTCSGQECVICVGSYKQNQLKYNNNLQTNLSYLSSLNYMEQLCRFLRNRLFKGFAREKDLDFQNKIPTRISGGTYHTNLIETKPEWPGRFLNNDFFYKKRHLSAKQSINPFESEPDTSSSTNTFEYDDNLNPFEN